MFKKILIANRGEIAVRIAQTCREMGIPTVAVCSTADRDAAVTRIADESVVIGPPAVRQSYLSEPAIIEAALTHGADAIHPGYGFLSEDPYFAEICQNDGITLIAPTAEVMRKIGDKSAAKTLMADAGIAVGAGSTRTIDSVVDAEMLAEKIGYPVIIKAVAGGGGRGMAVVRGPGELARLYRQTRTSAQAVFGDGRVYIERYVEDARHIEIQILCDQYGNAVHLGERDCSVQRRHQKVIEETPATDLSRELIEEMGAQAVAGATSIGFVGAGTFEFLVDPEGGHSFMEINGRIQVEHPVTEAVTGIDVVREQIRIAAGLPLEFEQRDVRPRGAALECRIIAEDADRGFLPTAGTLTEFSPPSGPFVRVDTHAYPGWRVTTDYDSLLAKVIVWGADREQAIARADRALSEFRVEGAGMTTSIPFIREVLADKRFRAGSYRTSLIDEILSERREAP
ncbi:acetyl/propionyl/methylcrotonyl-CoA carboxylase subunit alpha [Nocardiopsis alba]|uniref:acetyl-CoA carboxylase biotin carboxylase subunit n=1 Tax=Nocardiopsis alba TaxID=53437 RepID=UPI0033AC6F0F